MDIDKSESIETGDLSCDEVIDETRYYEFLKGEKELFAKQSICTKGALLASLHKTRETYAKDRLKPHPIHAPAFYAVIDELLERAMREVRYTEFPEPLPEWWSYSYDIGPAGISIHLDHYGWAQTSERVFECMRQSKFALIDIHAKLLTVTEYSKEFGYSPVTVRQWIRRGKIRSAVKAGNGWLIPECAELPIQKGYVPCRYTWSAPLTCIPEKFGFLEHFCAANFTQDSEKKDLFQIRLEFDEHSQPVYVYDSLEPGQVKAEILSHYPDLVLDDDGIINMSGSEREELELCLIADPMVRCDEGYFGTSRIVETIGADYCPSMMMVDEGE